MRGWWDDCLQNNLDASGAAKTNLRKAGRLPVQDCAQLPCWCLQVGGACESGEMKILIACEYSGKVRDAFIAGGGGGHEL